MTVNLTFNGNSDDAQAAIAKLERKYENLENKLKQVGKVSKSAADEGASSFASMGTGIESLATKIATVSVATGALKSMFAAVGEQVAKMNTNMNNFGSTVPEQLVKFQIQSGATDKEVKDLLPQIKANLDKTPVVDMMGAIKIQTQLASSGFDEKDVASGAALNTVLRYKAATNSFGTDDGDPKEAIKSISQFTKGLGLKGTAKDIDDVNTILAPVFKESTVTPKDLEQLASKTAQLKSFGMTAPQMVGSFAAVAEQVGGNKADTGLANMVDRLSTAGAHPEREAMLAKIGLKPADVAMSKGGNSIFQVIDTMQAKLKGVDEVSKNNFMSGFFGQDAAPSASILFSDTGEARARHLTDVGENGRAMYDQAVETFQKSRFSNQMRTKNAEDFSTAQLDDKTGNKTWAERKKENSAQHGKRLANQESAGGRMVENMAESFKSSQEGWLEYFGLTANDVAENQRVNPLGLAGPVRIPGKRKDDLAVPQNEEGAAVVGASGAISSLEKKMDENTEAVRKNTEALTKGKVIARNAQRE